MNIKERILEILEKNAKFTNTQLAAMLNYTEKEIASAINELEKDGVIKGYKAIINWEKLNTKRASALIEVKVTPQMDTGFDETAKRLMEYDEVEAVYLMSGGYDLALTVNAETMSDIAMFVSKRLACISGVLSMATHFILTKYKEENIVFQSDLEEKDERGSNLCD